MGTKLLRAIDGHPAIVCAALFAIALAIHLPGIASRSLWLDEAWTLHVAHQPAAAILEISRQDQHPPGYYLLAAGWERAFGLSEASIRSLSLLASALSAVVFFLLARRFFGVEAAAYATLLLLAAGEHAYYATEARSYALTGLLCLVSFWIYLLGFEKGDGRIFLWLGPLNALAVYVHFTVAFAFVTQLVGIVLLVRRSPRAVLFYVAGQAIALLLFLPEVSHLFRQMPKAGEYWLHTPGSDQLLRVLLDFAGGWLALGLYAALLVAGAVAIAARGRGTALEARRTIVVALWAIVPIAAAFAVAQATPIFLTRYLLFASFAWYLLAGVIAAALPMPGALRASAALAVLAASLIEFREGGYRGTDWRALADVVRRQRSDGAVVLVLPGYECLPLGYYLEPDLFRSPDELTRALAARGVHCVDSEKDLPRPAMPPTRLIEVIAPHAPLSPEAVLLRYGQGSYRPIAVERFERGMVVVHEWWGRARSP